MTTRIPRSEPIALRAGRIEARWWPDASIHDLRVGGLTVLDAIYCAVRDDDWGTGAITIEEETIEHTPDGFTVRCTARHSNDEVDVRWLMEVVGAESGLTMRVTGECLRKQSINRAGLALLHPLAHRGALVDAETVDGVVCREFPDRISPDVLFTDVRSMTVHLDDGLEVSLDFEGDLFETEDHRNWMDAGWKTYCTPLSRPHPLERSAGHVIRQSVSIRVVGPAAPPRAPSDRRLHIEARPAAALPLIGSSTVAPGGPRWHFLGADGVRDLPEVVSAANARGIPVHLTLGITRANAPVAVEAVKGFGGVIAAVCMVDEETGVTTPELLALLGDSIEGAALIGVGTVGNFAELNRQHPPRAGADYIHFGVDGEMHHVDADLVLDGPRALPDLVRDASDIGAGVPVHVTVALPRSLPRSVDGTADATAAWMLEVVGGLAGAAAASVVVPDGLDPNCAALDILGRLCGFRAARLLGIVGLPANAAAIAVDAADAVHVFIANRTPHPITVPTEFTTAPVNLAGYGWTALTLPRPPLSRQEPPS